MAEINKLVTKIQTYERDKFCLRLYETFDVLIAITKNRRIFDNGLDMGPHSFFYFIFIKMIKNNS